MGRDGDDTQPLTKFVNPDDVLNTSFIKDSISKEACATDKSAGLAAGATDKSTGLAAEAQV